MHYVYFLKLSNGNIYTGSTADLRRRITQHEAGYVTSTHPYLPVKVVGYEAYAQKSDATRREKFMKTTEGKRLFRQQYRDILVSVEVHVSQEWSGSSMDRTPPS